MSITQKQKAFENYNNFKGLPEHPQEVFGSFTHVGLTSLIIFYYIGLDWCLMRSNIDLSQDHL